MTEIKLTKRYPHSRTEDITDAFMRGYEQGKKDGLKVGKQIVLGAFETYITADRKTEPQNYCDDCLYRDTCDDKAFFYACKSKATISKMEQVEDEPQTDIGTSDTVYSDTAGYVPRVDMTDCSWK